MKEFFVYLDESGDFETDPTLPSNKSGSLVGGFFWSKTDMPKDPVKLKNKIESLTSSENHATEISFSQKGERVLSVLSGATKFPISFVVFQNDKKKKIIDSTKTYLTVITEGLIQLLKKLIVLENDTVKLEVVAGFKKDTTQEVTGSFVDDYIPIDEYKEQLSERIAVEKAKLNIYNIQHSAITIELADDKRNTLLILCDYICNFWYTRNANAFSDKVRQGGRDVTIRSKIEPLYDQDYVFPLFSTEEDDHVLRMVQDGFYADALFEACAGMLSEGNCNLVMQSLIKLPPKKLHRQLDGLSDYIGDLLIFRESEKLTSTVLDGAERICVFLDENKRNNREFYIDVLLYQLAFLNNSGRLGEMEHIFEKAEKFIASFTAQTLNAEKLIMYYTRRAVYLQDLRRYEESISVCESMEALLRLMEDVIRCNDCLRLEGEVKSEELGKILGTKLQAMIPLCYLGKREYDEARKVSDMAIEQFEYEDDKIRQYQYRAELEAVCGHVKEALEWIEESFNGKKWKEYISNGVRDIYDIYNLLFIAAFTKETDPKGSMEIANRIYEAYDGILTQNESLRSICNLFMGYAMLGNKRMNDRGKTILQNNPCGLGKSKDIQSLYIQKTLQNIRNGRNDLRGLFEDTE